MNTNDNKEEFQFWNDEWNKPQENKRNIIIYLGEQAKKEFEKAIEQEYLKNNKQDGRRYKK
jgi:hypothetical protein